MYTLDSCLIDNHFTYPFSIKDLFSIPPKGWPGYRNRLFGWTPDNQGVRLLGGMYKFSTTPRVAGVKKLVVRFLRRRKNPFATACYERSIGDQLLKLNFLPYPNSPIWHSVAIKFYDLYFDNVLPSWICMKYL